MSQVSRPNVNLLVYHNRSVTKIKLFPGQVVELHQFRWTDEGWASSDVRYEYDTRAGVVRKEVESSGKDCDGRLDVFREYEAHPDALNQYHAQKVNNEDWIESPWRELSASQRDYTAEAAGY